MFKKILFILLFLFCVVGCSDKSGKTIDTLIHEEYGNSNVFTIQEGYQYIVKKEGRFLIIKCSGFKYRITSISDITSFILEKETVVELEK